MLRLRTYQNSELGSAFKLVYELLHFTHKRAFIIDLALLLKSLKRFLRSDDHGFFSLSLSLFPSSVPSSLFCDTVNLVKSQTVPKTNRPSTAIRIPPSKRLCSTACHEQRTPQGLGKSKLLSHRPNSTALNLANDHSHDEILLYPAYPHLNYPSKTPSDA